MTIDPDRNPTFLQMKVTFLQIIHLLAIPQFQQVPQKLHSIVY